ncbi:MAG TPA: MraY family glycosyltransferase [Phycisphaerales bacterium]|nr:MraY family glycosyltransferase [Phycisphaerales bacterium]
MVWLSLLLVLLALSISLPLTALLVRLGHRLKTYDSPGATGHAKELRRVPNTGGIAIFAAIGIPLAAGLTLVKLGATEYFTGRVPALAEHLPGIAERTPPALTLLACLTILHLLGVIDDRRALGPWVKLAVMFGCAGAVTLVTQDARLLSAIDPYVGGPWLSLAITAMWIVLVTNALNFIDNMDGLCAGVATIAGGCFLAAALLNGQWFVAASLALLVGASLGFLAFNVPPARIFMGDGGSLVIGFTLAFLTVRTTYYDPARAGGWYAVFMPLAVLAVPLYDFVAVSLIRVRQGRSPFVGDQQHLSHRLVLRGFTKPAAVGLMCSLAAITGVSGIILGSLQPWQAILVGMQTVLTLLALAFAEHATRRDSGP